MRSNFENLMFFLPLIALTFLGCGGLNFPPTAGIPNDIRPTFNVIAQGQFAGQNSRTVTGTAIIFSAGSSSYVLRLEGISTPAESGLMVQVFGDTDGKIATFSLRSASGSQNYFFTASSTSIKFNNVYIFSIPKNINYGVAQLF